MKAEDEDVPLYTRVEVYTFRTVKPGGQPCRQWVDERLTRIPCNSRISLDLRRSEINQLAIFVTRFIFSRFRNQDVLPSHRIFRFFFKGLGFSFLFYGLTTLSCRTLQTWQASVTRFRSPVGGSDPSRLDGRLMSSSFSSPYSVERVHLSDTDD